MAGHKGVLVLVVLGLFSVTLGAAVKQDTKVRSPSHGSGDWLNFDCSSRPNGIWPDLSRGCHQYYICKDQKKTTHHCKEGRLFDTKANACILEASTSCPTPADKSKREVQKSKPTCDGKENGYHADLKRKCRFYDICKDGVSTSKRCPSNFLFDDEKRACKHPQLYACPNSDENRNDHLSQKERRHLQNIVNNLEYLLKEEELQKA